MTRLSHTCLCACIVILVCSGCAENAVFTLILDVPAPSATDTRTHVVVEARSGIGGMESFMTDWQQTQISGIMLTPPAPPATSGRNRVRASIETSGDKITEELLIKVRFCVEERCTDVLDGNAPELRLTIERAFYLGQYTEYEQTLDALPPETVPLEVAIDKCEVAAHDCIDGSPTSWCVGDMHYCE